MECAEETFQAEAPKQRNRSDGSVGQKCRLWREGSFCPGVRSWLGLRGHAKRGGRYPKENGGHIIDSYRVASRPGVRLKKSLFKLPREERDESHSPIILLCFLSSFHSHSSKNVRV